MASIPDAMGIINCTHVHLFPSGHKEHIYKNRKGYHSMNIQVVCDSQLVIRDVVPGFPVSVHDVHILRQSQLFENFEKETFSCG